MKCKCGKFEFVTNGNTGSRQFTVTLQPQQQHTPDRCDGWAEIKVTP